MILVVGGAYQGKTSFVCDQFKMNRQELTDGTSCNIGETNGMKGIYHLHEYIRRFMIKEMDPLQGVLTLIEQNPELIMICNELGCGLVPVGAFERKYRETVGRIQCELAKRAKEVYRVYCGVGVKIK